MRFLEIIFFLITVSVLFVPRSASQRTWRFSVALVGVILLAHTFFEGSRWQLYLAYCIALTARLIINYVPSPLYKKWIRPILLIGVWFSAFLAWSFPVVVLDAPSGYPTGTISLDWIDEDRLEIHTEEPDDLRELVAQIWYPAEPDGEPFAPYITNSQGIGASLEGTVIPNFVMNHINLLETFSYQDANIREWNEEDEEEPYPVIVFLHGLGGFRMQNTQLTSKLAARGYVVIALDHPYGAGVTTFEDERIIPFKMDIIEWEDSEQMAVDAIALADVWAKDIRFALDQLEAMSADKESIFYDQLDLERVAIIGHSTGAAAAYTFCQEDEQCDAVVGLDPWMVATPNTLYEVGISQPTMILKSSAEISPNNDALIEQFWSNLPNQHSFYGMIENSFHLDFSDIGHLSPLLSLPEVAGGVEPSRMNLVVSEYVREFVDRSLQEKGAPLLYLPSSEYPEVVDFRIK